MPSKLPILESTLCAYQLPLAAWQYALKISWFWLILFFLYDLIPNLDIFQLEMFEEDLQQTPVTQEGSLEFIDVTSPYLVHLYWLGTILLPAIGWSSIIVLWHRHLLLNEHRQGLPIEISQRTFSYLWRFILIFWHLILNYLIIAGILMIIVLVVIVTLEPPIEWSALPTQTTDQENYGITSELLWTSGILFIVAMFLGRCGVALPAAAIDHKGFGLKAAWKKTAGSSLRISLILLLSTLPIWWALDILSEALTQLGLLSEFVVGFLDRIIYEVGYLFLVFVSVSTLSISFAFLAEGRTPTNLARSGRNLGSNQGRSNLANEDRNETSVVVGQRKN